MLTGSLVAIATPMQPGGALDLAAYRKLIDFPSAHGASAIVAVGTTGESPTVDFDEHRLLLKTARFSARGDARRSRPSAIHRSCRRRRWRSHRERWGSR